MAYRNENPKTTESKGGVSTAGARKKSSLREPWKRNNSENLGAALRPKKDITSAPPSRRHHPQDRGQDAIKSKFHAKNMQNQAHQANVMQRSMQNHVMQNHAKPRTPSKCHAKTMQNHAMPNRAA